MPALTLAFVATAAVFALGSYLFGAKDDDPTPSGGSGTQTQTPRPPPPPPPYPSRFAATSPHIYTAPKTWTSTQGVSPYAQTPSQTRLSSTRFDELASLEDANKLRAQARRRGQEMSEAHNRAKSAQKKGYYGAAQAHRQEAIKHEKAKEDLNKEAAKIIFRERNKNRKDGVIDLHDLHVPEAIRFAQDEVQNTRLRGKDVVHFITGKGLHSDGGKAKIRPALEDYFTKRGLKHSLDPKNAGVLIVRLDRQ